MADHPIIIVDPVDDCKCKVSNVARIIIIVTAKFLCDYSEKWLE